MLLSQIVLPVTPAFVPQPVPIYAFSRHDNFDIKVFDSKIFVSSPCWLGTEVMPMAQALQIPPIVLPVQAIFVPQPRNNKNGSFRFRGAEPDSRAHAEAVMFQGFDSWQPGAFPLTPLPDNIERVEGGIMEDANPSRETVIREIDLGEAGTMQVIVRIKGDKAKRILPLPNVASQPLTPSSEPPFLSMGYPVPQSSVPTFNFDLGNVFNQPKSSPILPTAGQLLPPGSMRNVPVMPAIADAWKQSTAPVVK